jgi:hypothetical protein
VTWVVVGILVIAFVAGGMLVFRALGRTAQAGAQVGQQGITGAHDADVQQALLSSANAMETWFTDHQNYAIKAPVAGLSASAHVQFWSTESGYCLRAYAPSGTAEGPTNGTYWWYDSQGGGLQRQPSATPTGASPGAICPQATTFTMLN